MAQKGQIGVTTENIFPVIKKFLYSDHEIFLRELVAKAYNIIVADFVGAREERERQAKRQRGKNIFS